MQDFVIASDWPWGVQALLKGAALLRSGSSALDAIEEAVRVVEDNPNVNSVGTGGLPNAEGVLELDASIMDGTNMRAGAVACLQMTRNPISVARKVMELTPHVLLSGEGARKFARTCGFPEYDPLTPEALHTWRKLRDAILSSQTNMPVEHVLRNLSGFDANFEGLSFDRKLAGYLRAFLKDPYGTVGVVATDQDGQIGAGTSTSGWAMRLPGRVSDSSVIGAGTYATKTAAASSTGLAETNLRHCLAKSVCELVEDGFSPNEACEAALLRVLTREKLDHMIAVICVDINHDAGGACTKDGFQFEYMRSNHTTPIIVHPEPVQAHV